MSQTLFPENIYEWESCDTSCCKLLFFFSENFKITLLHLCLVDCGLNVPMSVTCLARRKKVKGNGPNKDSAHEVHRLLETKVNASTVCET